MSSYSVGVHQLAQLVLDCSNGVFERRLDGAELCTAFAIMIICNSTTLSDSLSWKHLIEGKTGMTRERYHEIIHGFLIADYRDPLDVGKWKRVADLETLYRKASELLNNSISFLSHVRTTQCLDDDVENSVSNQLGRGEAATTCILRKEGWCVLFDAVCSVVDGIPTHVTLRESGGDVTQKFLEGYPFEGGKHWYFDRGYTAAGPASTISSKHDSCLGPMRSGLRKDHCFDIYDYKSVDTPSQALPAARVARGIQQVETFPGVGPTIRISRNKRTGQLVCLVVHRTSHSADGVVKFLAATDSDRTRTPEMLKTQNLSCFVRVQKKTPVSDKRRLLTVAATSKNENAVAALYTVQSTCMVDTVDQRDASWGTVRHLTMTASQADPLLKRELASDPTKTSFSKVRSAIFEVGGQSNPCEPPCSDDQDDEDEDGATVENWTASQFGVMLDAFVSNEREEGNELANAEDDHPSIKELRGDELEASLGEECHDVTEEGITEDLGTDALVAEACDDTVDQETEVETETTEVSSPHNTGVGMANASSTGESGGSASIASMSSNDESGGTAPTATATSNGESGGSVSTTSASSNGETGGSVSTTSSTSNGESGGSISTTSSTSNGEGGAETANTTSDSEIRAKNFKTVANGLKLHKSTQAMKIGTLTKPEIVKFARSYPFVKDSDIFQVGFVRNSRLRHIGCSPDGIGLFTDGQVFLLECKTRTKDSRNIGACRNVQRVDVGSEEYYAAVPSEWRAQLLHQAAVTNIRHVFLCVAAPNGPLASVIVTYDSETLAEYLTVVNRDNIRIIFDWFYTKALTNVKNSELINGIPVEADPASRRIIASHVRVRRAVYRYREETKVPIPPTKVFRFGVVNSYDIGKAGVDGFCRDIAQAMRGMTSVLKWRQLATVRYLYMALVSSVKIHNTYAYLSNVPEVQDQTLTEFRYDLRRRAGRLTDCVFELAQKLLKQPFDLTQMSIRRPKKRSVPVAPPTPVAESCEVTVEDLVCAMGRQTLAHLHRRASLNGRAVSPVDLWNGLPLADEIMSHTSPSAMIREQYLERLNSLLPTAQKIQKGEGKRQGLNTRRRFWAGTEGTQFRLSKLVLHLACDAGTVRPICMACNARPQAVPEYPKVCNLCNMRLCTACFKGHHNDKDFYENGTPARPSVVTKTKRKQGSKTSSSATTGSEADKARPKRQQTIGSSTAVPVMSSHEQYASASFQPNFNSVVD